MASKSKNPRRKDEIEFDAFVRRAIRAYARRAQDPDTLASLVTLRATVEQAIADTVVAQHQAGFSWTEIAVALNMPRQHAWRKWGPAVRAAEQAACNGAPEGTETS